MAKIAKVHEQFLMKPKLEINDMQNVLPLDNNKKLAVTCRVESGCLGPDGLNYIDAFCHFAQAELQKSDSDYVVWTVVHREDKTLAEIQYGLLGKILNDHKTDKYLSIFGQTLDDFEAYISDRLEVLIRQFMSNIVKS